MILVLSALFFLSRKVTKEIDTQIIEAHSYADLALEQQVIFQKLSLEYRYEKDVDFSAIKSSSKQLYETIGKTYQSLFVKGDSKYNNHLKMFHNLYSSQNERIQGLENISSSEEISQMMDDSEQMYFDALVISQFLLKYKERILFNILVINILFVIFFGGLISWLTVSLSNHISRSIAVVSDYVNNFSIETLSSSEVEASKFSDFVKLEQGINTMANRLLMESRNIQSRSVNDTIGNLSENLAHLINNPLSIISSSARILTKKSREALVQEEAREIEESVKRISSTTLSMKKLIQSKEKTVVSTFQAENIQHAIELYFLNKFLENNIEVIFDISKDHTVHALEYEIIQCVFNLVENSIDHLIKLECDKKWLRVSTRKSDSNIILVIEDCGQGADEDLIYGSMMSQESEKVGLYSVTQLISKNLGSVEFSALPNTAFTITLPSHSIFES